MSIRSAILGIFTILVFLSPTSLRAQYLYMDANGNGIHDAGDRVRKNRPTAVDIYLATNRNRDGSLAVCDNNEGSSSPLPMQAFSYGLVFRALGGTVSWNSFANVAPGFNFLYSALKTDTEYHVFYGVNYGSPWLEPGLHRLGRLILQVTSGSPSIEFEPTVIRPDGFSDYTDFGTPCLGLDFDDTYKLGSDFHDADGLAAPTPQPGAAIVVSPNPMNPTAKFAFDTSQPGRVVLKMFDVAGRAVRTVADVASLPAGRHELAVDGKSDRGTDLSSGIYFYRLESVDGIFTGRLTISR